MPRFLFYVNINPDRKHITGHCEHSQACKHVFKQLISNNTSMKPTIGILSQNNDKGCIKIGETDNSFWLIIWGDTYNNAKNHPCLTRIMQEYSIQSISDCKDCCQ